MLLYFPVRESLFSSEIGNYRAFGIAAVSVSGRGWKQAAFVSDVSVSFLFTAGLALRCTLGQLDPVHLEDVVEDEI